MVKIASALTSALLAVLLGGCATPIEVTRSGLRIEPLGLVRHGVSAQGLYEIGRYLQAQDRYREAAVAYRECVAREPKYVEAHNALGVVLSLQGRYDSAYASFARALALSPAAPHLWSNLGYAYFLAGEESAANAALIYGRSLAPADPKIRQLLARIQGHLGDSVAPAVSAESLASAKMGEALPELAALAQRGGNGNGATAIAQGVAVGWQVIQTPPLPLLSLGPAEYELQGSPNNSAGTPVGGVLSTSLVLEISNGNGVHGMAQRVSQTLAARGLPTARLTNKKGFAVRNTELHYRAGHEAAATKLLSVLPGGIRLRQTNNMRTDITIRLVLGKDLTKTPLSQGAASLAVKALERDGSGRTS